MRKLYTLLAAAVLVFTAQAAISFNNAFKPATKQALERKMQMKVDAGKQDIATLLRDQHKSSVATAAKAPRKASEVISEAPEGEVKLYNRSGGAYTISGWWAVPVEQDGLVEIVYAADGSVYIKDVLSNCMVDTYVKGTLDGNTITVPLGQTLITWEDYGYGLELLMADVTLDADGYPEDATIDESATEVTFTIDGNTISLNGTSATHVLTAFYDDDQSWVSRADYNSVYTETEAPEVVTPPAGIAPVTYWHSGEYEGEETHFLKKQLQVVKDGNDIYIQGLINGNDGVDDMLPEAWVKGTLENGVLTIPHDQALGIYASRLIYLVGSDDEENVTDLTFTYDEDADVFTADMSYYINGKSDQIYYFMQFFPGNIISKEEPQLPTEVEAPDGLVTSTYALNTEELEFDDDGNASYTDKTLFLQMGWDGSDVYIQGLCVDLPEAWVKGSTDDAGNITLPTGQFFGTQLVESYFGDNSYNHFLVGYGDNGLQDIVLTRNDDGSYATQDYVIDNEKQSVLAYYHIYTNCRLALFVEKEGKPANPEITGYTFNDSYGYGRMTCNIPLQDVDGNAMNPAKVYYRLYSEIKHKAALITLSPADYEALENEMTEIPYNFTDNWDIYEGGSTIYLNMADLADFNRIGLQVVYYGGMEDPNLAPARRAISTPAANESEIVWHTLKAYSGVNDINSAMQAKSVRYYNVAGMQSDKPFDGVNIVVKTFDDGTTSTTKVLK